MKIKGFLSLSKYNYLKGLGMAVLGAVYTVVEPLIMNNVFAFDWTLIWHNAAKAAFLYLSYSFVQPAPKTVSIDPAKTSVVDGTSDNKEVLLKAGN